MKITKRAEPQPAMPMNDKPVGTQFGPIPKNWKQKKMMTLPSLSDPKSPAAEVTGQRMDKCADWPVNPEYGKPTGQRMHKLPSLSDPKS